MISTHHREKLIHAIVFFAKKTRHFGKTKLFKLLYLLDFDHFRETGRSVTGLKYYAWEMGPVPVALAEEWDEFEPDLKAAIKIKRERLFSFSRQKVSPGIEFDDSYFSKRELRLMEKIEKQYHNHIAKDMVDVTHAENSAWQKVWAGGKGRNEHINYQLSLADDPNKEHILKAAEEYDSLLESVGTN